jgi:hypothetical protein
MMLPPRPLPLGDRLYLRTRYHVDSEELRRLERLGLSRAEIARLLETRARRPFLLSPRTDPLG